MRPRIWLAGLFLAVCFLGAGAYGQCSAPAGFVCLTQEEVNKTGELLAELKAAREVISKFSAERLATDAERAASQTLIKSLNDVLDTRGKIIAEYERMQEMWKKAFDLQQMIIENLEKQLKKPRSGFQKFMAALKQVLYFAAGVALGRGF